MAQVISIVELEAVINEVRRTAPPVSGALSPALCIFAEIYGVMIYNRAQSIDIDVLAEDARQEVRKWLGRPAAPGLSADTGNAGQPAP